MFLGDTKNNMPQLLEYNTPKTASKVFFKKSRDFLAFVTVAGTPWIPEHLCENCFIPYFCYNYIKIRFVFYNRVATDCSLLTLLD